MSAADLLEDGFPHGTRQGYDLGCRGGVCPAGTEHGLSCRRANMLAAGDYRYQKLVRAGATPAAIADALGLHPEIAAKPTPKKRAALPVEPVPRRVPPTPVPVPTASAPAPAPKPAKWAVRHAWVAFAPDGKMHGPFDDHGAAMTFVNGKLPPAPASPPEARKRRPMTDADVADLRRLHGEGLTDGEIARRISRSQPLISSWRRKLGLPGNAEFQRGRS